jgi:hypothetical protein
LTDVDDAQPQGQLTADGADGHEANRLRVRGLVYFAVALVGVIVLVQAVLGRVMHGFLREENELESLAPPRFAGDTGEYPAPRIQADPAQELKKMKAEDLGRLNSYGWVDRKAGVAHIPVERAIDILAKRGLPTAEERGVKPGEAAEAGGGGGPRR